jgi:hypothetical protein
MVVVVLPTFFPAFIAGLRAHSAYVFGVIAVHAHQVGCGIADSGTFQVMFYAGCHGLHIIFFQAR